MSRTLIALNAATATIAVLSACSSGTSQGAIGALSVTLPIAGQPTHDVDPANKFSTFLLVSDTNQNAVFMLKNKTFKNVGKITDGMSSPDGDWVDRHGNLYVADRAGNNVVEYKPGSTSPTFTYNDNMGGPIRVAVDSSGNVFEADEARMIVNEYAQKINSVMFTCSPGGLVDGVAVDHSGDVFVAFNASGSGPGSIAEYKGGLSGCKETVLAPTLTFAAGMAFDKKGNLLACDELAGKVDVIAPPYTSITGTLGSGYQTPFEVSINKSNKQAYVADWAQDQVQVLRYPSGTNIKTLGVSDGLIEPTGAVDGKNFVP
jgi:DNA-binding beta-propeller fold protein YncE